MATTKKLMGTTAVGGGLSVEDVFSTYLYVGNQTAGHVITNNIDLSGEGGLVWIKGRTSPQLNLLFDTERGAGNYLVSETTQAAGTSLNLLSSFNSDGFTLGAATNTNYNNVDFASWTFRKAPRFFDVVTWTGTGSPQNIAHNLGVTPGCIMIKSTSISGNWWVWHRTLPDARYGLYLNGTSAKAVSTTTLDTTDPTDTVFRVGTSALTNSSGETYVAYIFAHNDGDGNFGPDGDADIIKCGTYTGNGFFPGPSVNVGFEPEFVLIKNADAVSDWQIFDTKRKFPVQDASSTTSTATLQPNKSDAEVNRSYGTVTNNGFIPYGTSSYGSNEGGKKYIYIAIRRGPMRPAEDATDVFKPIVRSGTYTVENIPTGFTTDFILARPGATPDTNAWYMQAWDRMRGDGKYFEINSNNAETFSSQTASFDTNDGFIVGQDNTGNINFTSSYKYVNYVFSRRPKFFDIVHYISGTSAPRTLDHQLGAVPEMIWVRCVNRIGQTGVYHKDVGNTAAFRMKFNSIPFVSSTWWNNTSPTDTQFTVGTYFNGDQGADDPYIAYLFASTPGISKCGSYTGNGTSQTIDCGFSSGARFILIMRTDVGQEMYSFDTESGIVSGNDPILEFNRNYPQNYATGWVSIVGDHVDPSSSGFIVNQNTASDINVSGGTYVYYAVA